MGVELLRDPDFAQLVDVMEPIFLEEIGFSPRQVLAEPELDGVDRIQTMIFAMQMGLVAVLRKHGAEPAAVIGHSVGEIAAAVTAGALSLPDGVRLICRRSKLLRRVAGQGAMVLVSLPFAEVERRLAGSGDAVAAIASAPAATVVAGSPQAVEKLTAEWKAAGVGTFRVASDVAFHSPHMDPLLAGLKEAAADLVPRPYRVPVYSTALPDPRTTPSADGDYWAANLRNPVLLVAALSAALEDGHRRFLEISPHPVVAFSINKVMAECGVQDGLVRDTMRRNRPRARTLDPLLKTIAPLSPVR